MVKPGGDSVAGLSFAGGRVREQKTALYVVQHLASGNQYVGISCNPRARWSQHLQRAKHQTTRFSRALIKYGKAAFSFKVMQWFETREQALLAEDTSILFARPAYNLTIGDGPGLVVSLETRNRMSEAAKKRPSNQKGLKRSCETRERIRLVQTGKPRSDAAKRNQSLAMKGRPSPFKGKPWSPSRRAAFERSQVAS